MFSIAKHLTFLLVVNKYLRTIVYKHVHSKPNSSINNYIWIMSHIVRGAIMIYYSTGIDHDYIGLGSILMGVELNPFLDLRAVFCDI